MSTLAITEVTAKADLERFIRLPWLLYRQDPAWVPPLLSERRHYLDRARNPYFKSAKVALWIAQRDGVTVGRIAAQINAHHIARYPQEGQFGLIEAIDDDAIFAALFDTAMQWLRSRGMTRLIGPVNLSINAEIGLLVDGFDRPPMIMMGHAPPYYAEQITRAGFTKAMDFFCYQRNPQHAEQSSYQSRLLDQITISETHGGDQFTVNIGGKPSRPRLWGRVFDTSRKGLSSDIEATIKIFNAAWQHNWRFIPLTHDDVELLIPLMRFVVPRQWMWIGYCDNIPVAIAVMLPDLNAAIHDLDGRLLPFGWMRAAWRLKIAKFRRARVLLFGIDPQSLSPITSAFMTRGLYMQINKIAAQDGLENLEFSWILENNKPTRAILENDAGIHRVKTYRTYEHTLS